MTKPIKILLLLLTIFLATVFVAGFKGLMYVSELARLASCRPFYTFQWAECHSQESDGFYPPLASQAGKFHFGGDKIMSVTYSDAFCEFDLQGVPDEFRERGLVEDRFISSLDLDDWSYFYLGYAIQNEEQGLAFLKYYEDNIESLDEWPDEIPLEDDSQTCGESGIPRLHDVESTPEDDCQRINATTIPVVIERPENHRKPGGKVTFLDGHSEFIPYPGKFPMTGPFMEKLLALDAKYDLLPSVARVN